jgi:CheY-like chemotaxis protein
MDFRMPVMDGRDAIREIRALPGGAEPTIIAVTASAMDENRQELLGIGADDFIGKPFQAVELFHKIHQHLGVEYLYAEPDTSRNHADIAELTPESLELIPLELIDLMRESVIAADLDQLRATIRQVASHDATTALGLLRAADAYEYQKLLDLFDPAARGEQDSVPVNVA